MLKRKEKKQKTNNIVTKSKRIFTQPKPRGRQETGRENLASKSVLPWRSLIQLGITAVKLNCGF